jgi:hypothetical protein
MMTLFFGAELRFIFLLRAFARDTPADDAAFQIADFFRPPSDAASLIAVMPLSFTPRCLSTPSFSATPRRHDDAAVMFDADSSD